MTVLKIHLYGITIIENTFDLYEIRSDSDKYYVTVILNGVPQHFEVDSGAYLYLQADNDLYALQVYVEIEE